MIPPIPVITGPKVPSNPIKAPPNLPAIGPTAVLARLSPEPRNLNVSPVPFAIPPPTFKANCPTLVDAARPARFFTPPIAVPAMFFAPPSNPCPKPIAFWPMFPTKPPSCVPATFWPIHFPTPTVFCIKSVPARFFADLATLAPYCPIELPFNNPIIPPEACAC